MKTEYLVKQKMRPDHIFLNILNLDSFYFGLEMMIHWSAWIFLKKKSYSTIIEILIQQTPAELAISIPVQFIANSFIVFTVPKVRNSNYSYCLDGEKHTIALNKYEHDRICSLLRKIDLEDI